MPNGSNEDVPPPAAWHSLADRVRAAWDELASLADPDPAILRTALPPLEELETEVMAQCLVAVRRAALTLLLPPPPLPPPLLLLQTGRRWSPTVVLALDGGGLVASAFDAAAGRVHLPRAGLAPFLLGLADAGAEVVLWSDCLGADAAARLAEQVCVCVCVGRGEAAGPGPAAV